MALQVQQGPQLTSSGGHRNHMKLHPGASRQVGRRPAGGWAQSSGMIAITPGSSHLWEVGVLLMAGLSRLNGCQAGPGGQLVRR